MLPHLEAILLGISSKGIHFTLAPCFLSHNANLDTNSER